MTHHQYCYFCLTRIHTWADEAFSYGLHKECFKKWFGLTALEEFSSIARRSSSSGEPGATQAKDSWGASFFIGKFRKYSAVLGDASYILKVKDPVAPELPEVEFLCNQIARGTGIPVPDFFFIRFFGVGTFVTRNFVRKGAAVDLTHMHHYLPGGAAQYDCENVVRVILDETKRLASAETFVKACLFDALIGNGDRHARNLAFLVTPRGVTLAPVYDNASQLGLEQGDILLSDWNPTGKIATLSSPEPASRDYVGEFFRLGYGDIVVRWFAGVSLKKIQGLIEESFCGDLMKQAMKKLVTKRYEETAHAIEERSR